MSYPAAQASGLANYTTHQYIHCIQYHELLLISLNKNANIRLFMILIIYSICKQAICKKLDLISNRFPAAVLPVSRCNCGHS